MTDDLVTRYRLREGDMEPSPFGRYVRHDDHAARIEQDAATIARLEGERNEWRKRYHETHGLFADADEALTAAEAKVAALVEALTLAANRLQRCAVDYDTGSRKFIETGEWAEEARAALRTIREGKA